MGKPKLIEIVDEEGPVYSFEGLNLIRDNSELICCGFQERDTGGWRNIALSALEEERFEYTHPTSWNKRNTERKTPRELWSRWMSYKNLLNEIGVTNFRNPFRKEYWERWQTHSINGDIPSILLGGIACGLALGGDMPPLLGGFAFLALQWHQERERYRKEENLKTIVNGMSRALERYQVYQKGIKSAEIQVVTPTEAVDAWRNVTSRPEYTKIDAKEFNNYLRKVYNLEIERQEKI